MKTIAVSVIIVLIVIMEINAQFIQPAMDELSGRKDFLQETKLKSNLLIQQIGDARNTLLLATEQEMAYSNIAFISQTGTGHNTIVMQTGSSNEANLYSDGIFTKTSVTQTGDNNSIFSNLSNNTLQLYSTFLKQKGNNNNIEITLLGDNVISHIESIVSVTQTGNNLHFSGTYNSPDVPIQINQKSGTGGAGMSVIVTTSAFYFPIKD
jgi:minor curlin subunit